jgi:hypothetical protein
MLQRCPRRWTAAPIALAVSLCIAQASATATPAASHSQPANGNRGNSQSAPGHQPNGPGNASTTTTQTSTTTHKGASHNGASGHGANHSGPYDRNFTGAPSGNGNGNGKATGRPCAGCVGNADNKNPKGQYPNAATDGNNGYECDGNHGIGRTNPAHTGCRSAAPTTMSSTAPSSPSGPGRGSVAGQTASPQHVAPTPAAPTAPPVLGERTSSPGTTTPVKAVRSSTSAQRASKVRLPFTGFALLALAGIGALAVLLGISGLKAVPKRG